MNNVETDKTVAGLNSSLVMKFYDRLDNLPVPSLPTTSVQGGSRPPSFMSIVDKQKQARRVISRLRIPFGALLLAPNPGGVAAYRRIATENVITATSGGDDAGGVEQADRRCQDIGRSLMTFLRLYVPSIHRSALRFALRFSDIVLTYAYIPSPSHKKQNRKHRRAR
jgi:hypothetical protein